VWVYIYIYKRSHLPRCGAMVCGNITLFSCSILIISSDNASPEFTTLNMLQQASIRYNFSTLHDIFSASSNLVTQLNNVANMTSIKTYNSMHKLFVNFAHKIEDCPFDTCASYVPTLLPCMIITSFWCKYIYVYLHI
jgi:hypothetical protein